MHTGWVIVLIIALLVVTGGNFITTGITLLFIWGVMMLLEKYPIGGLSH